jgi:hypothetical protein
LDFPTFIWFIYFCSIACDRIYDRQ